MKSEPNSGRAPASVERGWTARDGFALAFGLFLGIALIKFGNPVVLEANIEPPRSFDQWRLWAWPTNWALWILIPLVIAGFLFAKPVRRNIPRALWILPLVWFGWQLISATHSEDGALTATTLRQFGGILLCYFTGVWVLGDRRRLGWLLIGVLAALAFNLVRATEQRLFEFPQERKNLVEGERTGWTNLPPETVLEMKHEHVIITTNGVDVANPYILAKYGNEPPANLGRFGQLLYFSLAPKPRAFGTLVYANALAGAILMLLPVALVLAFSRNRTFGAMLVGRLIVVMLFGYFVPKLVLFFFPEAPPAATLSLLLGVVAVAYFATRSNDPLARIGVVVGTLVLGLAALFWTGSKSGWLIALVLGGAWLLRFNWPRKIKWAVVVLAVVAGLVVFGVRFRHYFAGGATSVGARFDYWRAAVRVTREHPWVGSGPGTFQHPYERLKAPESEMAKLAHNDYLEQFSDSGIPGGLSYVIWIGLVFVTLARRLWPGKDALMVGVLLGLAGWFIQGFSEFSLYVPALAWTAFAFAGCLLGCAGNQVDKERTAR